MRIQILPVYSSWRTPLVPDETMQNWCDPDLSLVSQVFGVSNWWPSHLRQGGYGPVLTTKKGGGMNPIQLFELDLIGFVFDRVKKWIITKKAFHCGTRERDSIQLTKNSKTTSCTIIRVVLLSAPGIGLYQLCSFSWLIMLKRGNYARCYAHFLLCWNLCSRLCSFLISFSCPSFYMRFYLFLARFPLLFRCFALEHSFPTIPVSLALYSTTLLHTTKYSLKTFPETFFVSCTEPYGLHLGEKRQIKVQMYCMYCMYQCLTTTKNFN